MKKVICIAIISVLSFSMICCGNNDKKDDSTNNKPVIGEDSSNSQNVNDNDVKDNNNNDDKVDKNDKDNKDDSSNKEELIDVKAFMVNGDYKIKSLSNDLGIDVESIKGDGKSYQAIGYTGKGMVAEVYTLKNDGIYSVFFGDVNDEDANDSINYLDKRNGTEKAMLKAPIKVGNRWGNKEIVEVGENLALESKKLSGKYAKTWEKYSENGTEMVKVCYFSEGLGLVKYKIIVNGTVMEYFEYKDIEKIS